MIFETEIIDGPSNKLINIIKPYPFVKHGEKTVYVKILDYQENSYKMQENYSDNYYK